MRGLSNLPPGVTDRMIEEQTQVGYCEVCGGHPESDTDPCICPECPVCGSYGDLVCYANRGDRARYKLGHHTLIITPEQVFLRSWQDAIEEDQCRSTDYLEDMQ